jgi:hypothetical protein
MKIQFLRAFLSTNKTLQIMTMDFYNEHTISQSVPSTPHNIEHLHSTHVLLRIISLTMQDIINKPISLVQTHNHNITDTRTGPNTSGPTH